MQVRLCVRACVCVVYEECRVAVGVPDDAAGTLVVGERRLREVAGRRRDLAVLAVARHRHVFVADAVHHLGDVVVRLAARVARVTLHHPLYSTQPAASKDWLPSAAELFRLPLPTPGTLFLNTPSRLLRCSHLNVI